MTPAQFDMSTFVNALNRDRLTLFDRLDKMVAHSSQALSLGVIEGMGHRIRFLTDHSQNAAEEIRSAITQNKDYDKAIQIVLNQLKKGEVIFEKHAKNGDKTIQACANKDVLQRIQAKQLTLTDKTSGKDIAYSNLAELSHEQLQQICDTAEHVLPETKNKKEETKESPPHAAAAHKEEEIKAQAQEQDEEKPIIATMSDAAKTDKRAMAREALKNLEQQQLQEHREEEKKEEEKKEAAEILRTEVEKQELRQESIKEESQNEEIEEQTTTHDEILPESTEDKPEGTEESDQKEVP